MASNSAGSATVRLSSFLLPPLLCRDSTPTDSSSIGGNSFENKQGQALTASKCDMACAGDQTSICGGNWALNAYKAGSLVLIPSVTVSSSSPAPTVGAPSNSTAGLPSGWTAFGCRLDNVKGRTLNVDAYTSQKMTINSCIAHCAERGHTMAGVEYARECYCGSSFRNQGGAAIADEKCNMPCSGDNSRACGGPDALTVFKKTGASTARRAHKARAFGKAHDHADLF